MDVFPHLTKENLPAMKQKLLIYIETLKIMKTEYEKSLRCTESDINTALNDLKIIEENFEGKL